ncbi:unnamed protein product [Adineta steineri]|uniref:Uncharacterized protein n=2 Tax=Adineta steineri TaxID=433720 RepID=A0A819NB14_9BILA|nr:unnamed protein product [Adineta steineri]CAF3992132.1 unnamed protein product [Adineta steineri]
MDHSINTSMMSTSSDEHGEQGLVAGDFGVRPAIIFIPRCMIDETASHVQPRLLMNNTDDEQQAFIKDFQDAVVELLREFRREFPYKQIVRWSIEYGDDQQHCLEVLVKPPTHQTMDKH